ncbi:hypothetical protein B0H17DRAFT_1196766 [Mycena rosella]|uniref:Uncharacterized protein n=1 Tax=Mycena rosella TaxID=1033263 RepID=A0AAD7DUN0_MYCRO|nr:hypothetical protein B0H17DRAFT_1196766 [Mycena rosella]
MATGNLPDLAIRAVTPDITTFSKPFVRFYVLPFGGRSTAIRLSTGNFWVLASTPLTHDTKAAIDALRPVKWIMAGDAIHACYFSGFGNKDVAWFHKASKTLIVADLLSMFNLPGTEQYSKSNSSSRVPIFGTLDPWGSVHKHFVWGQGTDKAAMTRDAKTVLGWAPERIIMCHGDVIEKDTTKAWASAYSKYLS